MPYTKDEALAFIIDTRMTKDAYHKTSFGAKQCGANIYPSYDCLEKKDHILIRLCETFDFCNNVNLEEVYILI